MLVFNFLFFALSKNTCTLTFITSLHVIHYVNKSMSTVHLLAIVLDTPSVYRIRPNYRTVHVEFSQLLGKLVVKYVSTYLKGTL